MRPLSPAGEDVRLSSCAARHCAGTAGEVRRHPGSSRWNIAPGIGALRLTCCQNSRISQLEAKVAKLDDILGSQQVGVGVSEASRANDRSASRSPSTGAGETAEPSPIQPGDGVSLDPFQLGLLSTETGEVLLNRFRRSLTPHFPFVIIPESLKVTELNRDKPIVCLAVLFASAHDDEVLQGRISRLFEQMLAAALFQGRIASLENLQGLLVYIAW